MPNYKEITVDNVQSIIDDATSFIIDIRDAQSYQKEHIDRAIRFDEKYFLRLRKTPQRHCAVLVYCYHGISSRDIATLLCSLGFLNVYNLEGGFTAWQAYSQHAYTQKITRLTSAVKIKNPEVRYWLTNQDFDPDNINQRNEAGFTPLMQACRMGLTETARQLLLAGADINLTNNDGNNALWLACFSGDLATIILLIENNIDINNKNVTGATSLIYASSAGKSAVVKQLLDAGANPFIRTQDDFTAQDLAASPQTYHLFRKLRPTG